MHVVAVDPGRVSGIASLTFPWRRDIAPATWEMKRFETESFVGFLNPDVIVVESFVPRPGVRTWQPDAIEIIGALRYMAWNHDKEFVEQTPADAKGFVTNEKLKTIGWYAPSKDNHKSDAARHLFLYAVRKELIPVEAYV